MPIPMTIITQAAAVALRRAATSAAAHQAVAELPPNGKTA